MLGDVPYLCHMSTGKSRPSVPRDMAFLLLESKAKHAKVQLPSP